MRGAGWLLGTKPRGCAESRRGSNKVVEGSIKPASKFGCFEEGEGITVISGVGRLPGDGGILGR